MKLVLTLTSDRSIYKLHPELVHQVEQLLFSKAQPIAPIVGWLKEWQRK